VSATNGLALMRRAGAPRRVQEQTVDGLLALVAAGAPR
jgi:hypothetical protein